LSAEVIEVLEIQSFFHEETLSLFALMKRLFVVCMLPETLVSQILIQFQKLFGWTIKACWWKENVHSHFELFWVKDGSSFYQQNQRGIL